MEPVLQVALDHMHLKRALLAAKEAVDGGADWLEAGTPLVKSEGIEVVRQLKKSFPGKTIVADLKAMDTGAFEVEIAAKAGADVITVMGVTAGGTIWEAVGAARRYGWKIMVDLMRVADKPARAKELEKLGVDYLNMHVSIDEQMIAHTPLQELKAVAAATSIPVAVAGGLNSETVGDALKAGASIVIVGGAIIKAENVAEATRTIKKAIHQRKSIPTGLYKKYTDANVGDAFRQVSTPNLADAMQKRGVMTGLVPRIKHGAKLVGRALTVKTADGDWAKPVEAIDRAKSGDVIVIDVGGGPTAVWGELASNSCLVKGVAGVVIDGAVRDLDSILELNFPCFSRHVAPHAGEPKAGKVRVGQAMEPLRDLPYQDLGFAKLDSHRDLRRGYPEVILCLGKTPQRIVEIAQRMSESHDLVLATRATRSVYQRLRKALDGKRVTYHEGAAIVSIGTPPKAKRGPVLVVTAGTSDIPVAEEAGVTAELMGCKVTRLYDVGVAGVHRGIDQRGLLRGAKVIVVVAGVEGALPSVVAGLVYVPVIAVPTSVGYGARFDGMGAPFGMRDACEAGVLGGSGPRIRSAARDAPPTRRFVMGPAALIRPFCSDVTVPEIHVAPGAPKMKPKNAKTKARRRPRRLYRNSAQRP